MSFSFAPNGSNGCIRLWGCPTIPIVADVLPIITERTRCHNTQDASSLTCRKNDRCVE